jgi:hypothetical protein
MTNDEFLRLVLEIHGQEAAEAMRRKLDELGGSAKKTADTYEVLERQTGVYEVLERRVTETVQVQTTALDHLGIAMEKHVGLYQVATNEVTAFGHAATAVKGTPGAGGRGILGLSYAVQDFTSVVGTQGLGRALGAVQNNIPILIASLGAGAGLAGAVSIVSVGVGLLIDNWDKLRAAWGAKITTEEEAKRMKDLAEATEEAAKAGERLLKTRTPEQKEAEKNLQRAVEAFGGEDVLKETTEALKAARGDFGAEANRRMAQILLTNVQSGNRRAQEELRNIMIEQGRGPIAQVLTGGATPQEEEDARNRQAKEMADRRRRGIERQKEEREQHNRLVDELNQQGQDAQKQADEGEARRVKESMRVGRQVGEAAMKQEKDRRAAIADANKGVEDIPMLKEDATPMEIRKALLENQARLAANAARDREFLMQARRLSRQLQDDGQPALQR